MSSGRSQWGKVCCFFSKGVKLCELELHVLASEAGSSKGHSASSLFTGMVTFQAAGCSVRSLTSLQPPCCEEAQATLRGKHPLLRPDNPNPGPRHVREQPPVLTSLLSDSSRLSPNAVRQRERCLLQ